MTKLKRQKRRKKFQYHVNRKRLNKKSVLNAISETFQAFPSTEKNFKKNGLVYDINKDIKCRSNNNETNKSSDIVTIPTTAMVSQLEEAASVVEKKQSNMSKDQIEYLGYLVNKYGDDFKAMAKDRRNYLQHTWKQLRQMIKTFKMVSKRHERIFRKK